MAEVVKTICGMCHRMCGIDVRVENGRIVKVAPMKEHQFHHLCERAQAIPELVYSPERLTHPLVRVNGELKEVSWDKAFSVVAEKLTDIKEKHGAKAVLAHFGVAYVRSYTEYVARRFFDLYGTPNYTTGASLCYLSRAIAYNLTNGAVLNPDYSDGTKCVMVWGNNPVEANVPLQGHNVRELVKKGAKLIVVDPKAIELAKQADIHAQIRPGTDCALALAMLNVIIAEGLYDKDFVREWTVGFDKLAEHVKQYSPEKVAEITWVPAETIRNMARIYATSKPACISIYVAMDHSTNGVQAIRAIAALMAVTGNIDVPGGNTYTSAQRLSRLMTNLRLPDRISKDRPVGADYPLFTRFVGETQAMPAIEQMVTEKPYPIKGLFIAGENAVLNWPNTNKFKQGREKLDLMVVIDIFKTESAKMADVVLPGVTFMERLELKDYLGQGVSLVALANNPVKPIGSLMPDWQIWAELGKRMGWGEYFPWQSTEELLKYLLAPTPISLDELKQKPAGIHYAQREFRKYLKNGFNTPSKKVELYSETLKEFGHDPLPTFHEPTESPVSRPDLAKDYPLLFLGGQKTRAYTHSQYRNLPSLRRLVPEPLLEINPQTARGLGIKDGDRVVVESPRGSIRVKAKLSEDVHPRTVAMQHGWNEANANYLTDDMARDPISGYPALRSVLCRVTKVG